MSILIHSLITRLIRLDKEILLGYDQEAAIQRMTAAKEVQRASIRRNILHLLLDRADRSHGRQDSRPARRDRDEGEDHRPWPGAGGIHRFWLRAAGPAKDSAGSGSRRVCTGRQAGSGETGSGYRVASFQGAALFLSLTREMPIIT